MKHRSPLSESGLREGQIFKVTEQSSNIGFSERSASPTAFFTNRQSTANEAEQYFSEFVELQRQVHLTLDPVDGARAAIAFRKFLDAYNRVDDEGLA